MKQISNKEYEKYQQYQTDKLHGRILTPDGPALSAPVCGQRSGKDQYPYAGDAGQVQV